MSARTAVLTEKKKREREKSKFLIISYLSALLLHTDAHFGSDNRFPPIGKMCTRKVYDYCTVEGETKN